MPEMRIFPGIQKLNHTVLICLSSHGFGHLGQVTPVVHELHSRFPDMRLIIRSRLPEFKLREKLGEDILIQRSDSDIGMIQKDALNIDMDLTQEKYRNFHRRWNTLLEEEKKDIGNLKPDIALVNIPYLCLAAVHELGIPSIAFSSLNWAEIYQYFFHHLEEAPGIVRQMLDAYNQAESFLQPVPAMNMPEITNGIGIDPVAQTGTNIRKILKEQIGLKSSEILVLVSMGGMDLKPPCNDWPRFPDVRFLVPESWKSAHPDTVPLEVLGHPFSDLMASADLLICKPGYGSFVEAACNRMPVLYLPRQRWPESSALIDWFTQYQPAAEISTPQFERGSFKHQLHTAFERRRENKLVPGGAAQVANAIAQLLQRTP